MIRKIHTKRLGVGKPFTMVWLVLMLQACGTAPSTTTTGGTRVFDQSAYDSALSLMKDGQYEKAAARLEEIARTDDRRAGPYINLGIAYRQLGKLDEAKQALQIATGRREGNEIAWNELGLVYRKLGEFQSARDAYEKSIRKRASYGKGYLNLGILCDIYLEDLNCAIRNYEKYQKLGSAESKKVTLWLADVRKRAGKSARKTK